MKPSLFQATGKRVASACVLLVSFAAAASAQTGTDLKVTDVSGAVVNVKNACVDYTALASPLPVIPVRKECEGIRIFQGVAEVTLRWKVVAKLTLLREKAQDRFEAEVSLVNGKVMTVELEKPARGLKGETDLGDYKIDLAQVKTIEPVRRAAK
jgi:hypothetical protein